MTIRTAFALLALLPTLSASRSPAADPPKPNFILINIDDLGYADIGPYGAETARTPNLDRLASEGRLLTSHYAAPVCSPSRASLMTGCYPKRVLPIPHVLFPKAAVGLNPEERTIAELLKEAGYATACIGKWHLGDQPEFLPTRQGFDSYFGLPYSNDMGPPEDGAKSNPGQPIPKPRPGAKSRPFDETGIKGLDQPPLPLLENENAVERVRAEEQFTLTRRYTERAVQFIRDQKDKPFFLYLPHTAVHFPHYPSKRFLGTSAGKLLQDWVREVDWSVGQLVDAVRELNLQQRTLVFFTSDNGGSLPHGSNNAPLRGSKGSTWEGGIRTCTLAWWPGKIPAGTRTDEITSMMDVLPTFVKLAGGSLPAGRKLDGHDIWPLLAGKPDAKSPTDVFYYYRGFQLQAVRSGPWKLHLAKGELYHLGEDIGEANNVAARHADEVKRLRSLADRMQDDLGLDNIGPGCRPLVRVDNPEPLLDEKSSQRN